VAHLALSYVVLVLTIHIPWHESRPDRFTAFRADRRILTVIVAVFGTTISPYSFFWQRRRGRGAQCRPAAERSRTRPKRADHLRRIKIDTYLAWRFRTSSPFASSSDRGDAQCRGITEIQTSAQAPGHWGAGGGVQLRVVRTRHHRHRHDRVPVLAARPPTVGKLRWNAGSTEAARARGSTPSIRWRRWERGRWIFSPIDPIVLVLAAVINGVIAVPIMVVMMLLADDPKVMGNFVVTRVEGACWLAPGRWRGGGRDDRDLVSSEDLASSLPSLS